MFYKRLFPTIALLFACAAAHASPEPSAGEVQYQPLSAKYRQTRIDIDRHQHTADWHFFRKAQQVQTSSGDYAEVWQRDERGELTLTRVFHQDRKLIQYTPGELKTQHRVKDWGSLNGFFDPRHQPGLKKIEEVTFMGHPASRYAGKAGRDDVEVIWLEKEAMLARYIVTGRDGSVRYELTDLRTTPEQGRVDDNLKKAENYAYIDGADLGDMEYDPFVRRVLGEGHDHGSHAHHH